MRLMTTAPSRWTALVVATSLLMPALAGCGNSGSNTTPAPSGGMMAPAPQATAPRPGLSGKQKVVLLAGAALLYYIYKKDQSNNAAAGAAKPQLYQSKNGGIYYRDPSNPKKVTWVTAPSQPIAVPADQLQRYAPDYQQYQGQPAPPAPPGDATQSATQYDPSLASLGGPSGPGGPPGPRM